MNNLLDTGTFDSSDIRQEKGGLHVPSRTKINPEHQGDLNMPGKGKYGPEDITAAERQSEALMLRKRGLSFEAIAAALGFASRSGAFEAVKAGLCKTLREPAEDLRQLELSRLDSMLESIAEPVTNGDLNAIATALRISERRSRLLGLDRREAPVSVKLPKLERAADALPVTAALLDKAAEGELLPEEATKLAGLAISFMKAAETANLEERIRELEAAQTRRNLATSAEASDA